MNKQYKIVQATTVEELENKVNVMIGFGWNVESGMVTETVNGKTVYNQTVVRTSKDISVENRLDNNKQLLHG